MAAALAGALDNSGCAAANERPLFISLGATARPPIGWAEFCSEYPRDCDGKLLKARDVVLTGRLLKDVVRINNWSTSRSSR